MIWPNVNGGFSVGARRREWSSGRWAPASSRSFAVIRPPAPIAVACLPPLTRFLRPQQGAAQTVMLPQVVIKMNPSQYQFIIYVTKKTYSQRRKSLSISIYHLREYIYIYICEVRSSTAEGEVKTNMWQQAGMSGGEQTICHPSTLFVPLLSFILFVLILFVLT